MCKVLLVELSSTLLNCCPLIHAVIFYMMKFGEAFELKNFLNYPLMIGGQFFERTDEEHEGCEEHWKTESTAAGNPAGLVPCASSKETAQSFLMITLRCIGKVLFGVLRWSTLQGDYCTVVVGILIYMGTDRITWYCASIRSYQYKDPFLLTVNTF